MNKINITQITSTFFRFPLLIINCNFINNIKEMCRVRYETNYVTWYVHAINYYRNVQTHVCSRSTYTIMRVHSCMVNIVQPLYKNTYYKRQVGPGFIIKN